MTPPRVSSSRKRDDDDDATSRPRPASMYADVGACVEERDRSAQDAARYRQRALVVVSDGAEERALAHEYLSHHYARRAADAFERRIRQDPRFDAVRRLVAGIRVSDDESRSSAPCR